MTTCLRMTCAESTLPPTSPLPVSSWADRLASTMCIDSAKTLRYWCNFRVGVMVLAIVPSLGRPLEQVMIDVSWHMREVSVCTASSTPLRPQLYSSPRRIQLILPDLCAVWRVSVYRNLQCWYTLGLEHLTLLPVDDNLCVRCRTPRALVRRHTVNQEQTSWP